MKGKKLFELLSELNASQSKKFIYYCSQSNDKRIAILLKLIRNFTPKYEDFEQKCNQYIGELSIGLSPIELDDKKRRYLNYFSTEIEQFLANECLENNENERNIILAEYFEKIGNPYLVDHYFEKSLKQSQKYEDFPIEIRAFRGLIRRNTAYQSDKIIKETLRLNELSLNSLENFYHQKLSDYYNNISNYYIGYNIILKLNSASIISEIEQKIIECKNPFYQVSYYISLARFYFDQQENFLDCINKAEGLNNKTDVSSKEQQINKRKILFLKLVLGFYLGLDQSSLTETAEEILNINQSLNFIDNNTFFYKILFIILNGDIELAKDNLQENKKYFKGDQVYLKHFLQAVIFYKNRQWSRALKSLESSLSQSNFFVALFSRLLQIKIHLNEKDFILCDSLVTNTERFLKQSHSQMLVFHATMHVIKHYKNEINLKKSKSNKKEIPYLPPLYYLFINR